MSSKRKLDQILTGSLFKQEIVTQKGKKQDRDPTRARKVNFSYS